MSTKRIKFHRPVSIGGAFFSREKVHDVDETLLEHWLVKNMLISGDAVLLEPAPVRMVDAVFETPPEVTPAQTGDDTGADSGETTGAAQEQAMAREGAVAFELPDGLDTLKKLRAYASEKGIEIPGNVTKEQDVRQYLTEALRGR